MVTNRQVLTASRRRAESVNWATDRLPVNHAAVSYPASRANFALRRENVLLGHRQRESARTASLLTNPPLPPRLAYRNATKMRPTLRETHYSVSYAEHHL